MFGADLKNKTAVYAAVLFYGPEKPLVMREFANKIIEWNIIKVKRIILPRFLIRRSTYAGFEPPYISFKFFSKNFCL